MFEAGVGDFGAVKVEGAEFGGGGEVLEAGVGDFGLAEVE